MEQKIVPTSPKRRIPKGGKNEENAKVHAHPHLLFIVIVVTLLFGTVAGLLGFSIASSVPADWPILGKLNVVNSFEQERQDVLLATRNRENSIVSQSPQVVDQIVSVYNAKPTIEALAEFLGNAVALTADGWMVMPSSGFPNEETREQAAVILPSGESSTIGDVQVDEFSGLTFFQVTAEALPVVNFGSALQLRTGDSVSVIEKQMDQYLVYERRAVGASNITNAVRSTGEFQQTAELDIQNESHTAGLPAFYNNGNLAGIIVEGGRLIHSSAIHSVLLELTAEGTLTRSKRAVRYIQLAQVTDEEKRTQSLPDSGILIIESDDEDLEAGDVITAINSDFVDREDDLSTIIHSRPAGTTFFFTVQREGEEMTIEFTS